jgi:hypothetical protein
MFDSHDNSDLYSSDSYTFGDSDVPEPVEHWSLEDFTDVLQSASV